MRKTVVLTLSVLFGAGFAYAGENVPVKDKLNQTQQALPTVKGKGADQRNQAGALPSLKKADAKGKLNKTQDLPTVKGQSADKRNQAGALPTVKPKENTP